MATSCVSEKSDTVNSSLESFPEFDGASCDDEHEKIEIIHHILTQYPKGYEKGKQPEPEIMSVSEVFERIQTLFPDNILFDDPLTLKVFLEQRKFLFHTTQWKQRPTNTGFAHRRGTQEIVQFIQKNYVHSDGCRVADLLKHCQNGELFRVYDGEQWQQQPWDDSYFFFKQVAMEDLLRLLEDYDDYFELRNVEIPECAFVKLTPLAKSIPSLWKQNILPTPLTDRYMDGSRKQAFMIEISCCGPSYAKRTIPQGVYQGRRIAGYQFKKIPTNAQLKRGTIALVMAFYSIGVKADWKATLLSPFDLENSQKKKICSRSYMTANQLKKAEHIWQQTCAKPEDQVGSELNKEKAAIQFVDRNLSGEVLRLNQLMHKVNVKDSPFAETKDLLDFIVKRPHLYNVTSEEVVSCLNAEERWTHFEFLSYLEKKSPKGVTIQEMFGEFKSGAADYALQKIALEGELSAFCNRMEGVIGKTTLENSSEVKFVIRGALFHNEEVYIPRAE